MEWAKSEDTIIHLGCSITNFLQTTLLSMVLHLHAWQMHVFLYFLGPTYFHLFFHVLFFFWWAVQKGGGQPPNPRPLDPPLLQGTGVKGQLSQLFMYFV